METQADPCLIVQGRGGGSGAFHGTAGRIQYHLWVKDRLLLVQDRTASLSTSVAALWVAWITKYRETHLPNWVRISLYCPFTFHKEELGRIFKYANNNGIISYTTNCLYSYRPLVIRELRDEGGLQLKGDGKCCLKWIRKAAGFIFTHSVTCAAKRKQVTEECVVKPKHNTGAHMICGHLGRSVFLKTYFIYLSGF